MCVWNEESARCSGISVASDHDVFCRREKLLRGRFSSSSLMRSTPASNEAQTSAEEYAARNAALAQSDPRPPPPDISNDPSAEIISTHLKPGDLLIWNSFTYHSAPGNSLPRRRAAYNVTWVGDDVLFKDLPCLSVYRSSSCVHGQPINCDKFPMLRGKQ